MNIIVISDTHIPKRAKTFPNILVEHLKNADLIIHAGDWQSLAVYEELKKFAPVVGVVGNVDDENILSVFPVKSILNLGDLSIGITHGHGKGGTTEKRVLSLFNVNEVDLIIYGHSHIPVKKEHDGLVLFNPGSPTDKRKQPQYSFGWLQIKDGWSIEHIFFP